MQIGNDGEITDDVSPGKHQFVEAVELDGVGVVVTGVFCTLPEGVTVGIETGVEPPVVATVLVMAGALVAEVLLTFPEASTVGMVGAAGTGIVTVLDGGRETGILIGGVATGWAAATVAAMAGGEEIAVGTGILTVCPTGGEATIGMEGVLVGTGAMT